MTESASRRSPLPLEVDRIQSSRSSVGETRLRISGHWLDPQGEASGEEGLLVVHVEGRRHRFAPDRDDATEPGVQPGRWSASFTVPSWAEPRQDGQAALWLGSAVIPVPPLHGVVATPRADEEALGRRAEPPAPSVGSAAVVARPAPEPEPPPMPPVAPPPAPPTETAETPRSGPVGDLLLRDTVAALHAELEQRTAEAARLRGALAATQSELDARGARYSQLETVLEELRGQLEQLRTAVDAQRGQLERESADAASLRERFAAAEAAAELRAAEAVALRTELAASNVSREAASREAADLRAELERVGSELAVTHERVGSETGDLGEASRLLADAKALASELGAGDEGREGP
ncbi:MAG: hypothetical protein ACLPTJ_11840 [Solirubrobacteraceae bacterium]